MVSDEVFAKRHETYPRDTPDTKEGYFIRETFDSEPDEADVLTLLTFRYSLRRHVPFRDRCRNRSPLDPSR